MRLGWTKNKNSTTYRAVKTVRVDGNRNEQTTMLPLEEKMLSDFGISKFIVYTDAGLSSATNRVFNTYDKEDGLRGFITTQPIKTLKAFLQEWCLSDDGWILDGDNSDNIYQLHRLIRHFGKWTS